MRGVFYGLFPLKQVDVIIIAKQNKSHVGVKLQLDMFFFFKTILQSLSLNNIDNIEIPIPNLYQ